MTHHAITAIANDLRERWTFTDHAAERMQYRHVTFEDIATAFWRMYEFEHREEYRLNIYGRDGQNRTLRVTIVPEALVVVTVSLHECWTIGDTLALRENKPLHRAQRKSRKNTQ